MNVTVNIASTCPAMTWKRETGAESIRPRVRLRRSSRSSRAAVITPKIANCTSVPGDDCAKPVGHLAPPGRGRSEGLASYR